MEEVRLAEPPLPPRSVVVFDLGAVIITRELCVGIFDEIDCFIVLFSNGGLPSA